jgi:hypothetical protein
LWGIIKKSRHKACFFINVVIHVKMNAIFDSLRTWSFIKINAIYTHIIHNLDKKSIIDYKKVKNDVFFSLFLGKQVRQCV